MLQRTLNFRYYYYTILYSGMELVPACMHDGAIDYRDFNFFKNK